MADNNLGSSRDIGDLSNEFENFSSELLSDDKNLSIADQARKKSTESLKKQKEAQEAAMAAAANTIKGFYNFGKGLSNAQGGAGFESLNKIIGTTAKLLGGVASAIPIVGQAFEGIITGAAEVSKFMIGQFSKAYGNFEKLADSGVISTFEELKESAASIGLTYSDTEKVLTKYSTELANFGGSALKGRQRFQDLTFETKKVGESFQVIGISASDFADMQMSYIAQQQRILSRKNLTDKQLIDDSIQYIKQLDTLSKLTGISKKELQEQMMDRTRNARYMAGIAHLDPKIKENIDNLLPKLSALDADFGEGMQDAIASNAMGNSDKEKAALYALRAGGMDIGEEIQILKSGGDPKEFQAKVAAALKRYAQANRSVIKHLDSTNLVSRAYLASQNVQFKSAEELAKTEKEINERQKTETTATNTEGKKLAETYRAMYNSTRNIELLATGSKTMTLIMKKMADGIEDVIGKIYDLVGDDGIPDFLKFRKEERIAINQNIKFKKELDQDLKREVELIKEKEEIAKNPTDPKNKKRKLANERALTTIQLQIKMNRVTVEEQEEKVKIATAKKKKADEAAGFGPTVGAKSSSSGTTSTSSNTGSTPTSSNAGSTSTSSNAGSIPTSSNAESTSSNQSSSGAKPLNGVPKEFFISLYNAILTEAKLLGLPNPTAIAAVGASQSALETGWGKSLAGGNNYFGIKAAADNSGPGVATQEYINGKMVTIIDKFRQYNSMNESAADYVKFLRDNKRYAGVLAATTPEDAITAQGKSGYATDPDYAAKLRSIYSSGSASLGLSAAPKQARTGGIFSGPSTGYFAILHGDEMVIPANPGSSELQFNSTMSQNQSDDMIPRILLMMTKKVDKMIRVTRNEISNQRKLAINGVK